MARNSWHRYDALGEHTSLNDSASAAANGILKNPFFYMQDLGPLAVVSCHESRIDFGFMLLGQVVDKVVG